MDNIRLQQILNEVRADIARLNRELEEARHVESYVSKKLGGQTAIRSEANRTHNMTQTEAAERALAEAGKPLKTDALVEIMVSRGYYQQPGERKQLVNSVFSAMRRSPDKFVKVSAGTWALTNWKAEKHE